jgi:hypothetical protein
MNVPDIIEKFKPKTFEKELDNLINSNIRYATNLYGEGGYGMVYTQNIGKYVSIKVKDENVFMKSAIKKMKHIGKTHYIKIDKKYIEENINKFTDKSDNILIKKDYQKLYNSYIYSSDRHPNGEFIILSILSKLWYNAENPHINLIISPLSIDDEYQMDGFIIEKCGIDTPITYDIKNVPIFSSLKNRKTSLETMYGLLSYCLNICDNSYNIKNDVIGNFNIVDMLDEILLSYLFSYQQIQEKAKVSIMDLHINNILIKFINDFANVGVYKLSDYDSICYQINNKKYYLKMGKFIIKFSDVGLSVYNNNNIFVIGDSRPGIELKQILFSHKLSYYIEFLLNLKNILPHKLFKQTICHTIIDNHFDNFSHLSGAKLNEIKPYELIKKYFKRFTKNNYKKPFHVKS